MPTSDAAPDRPLVLVIEDSKVQRTILCRLLEGNGYRVAQAASGEEARQRVTEEVPEAVLMDWELPDISGPELIGEFHDVHELRWTPVIMVTSYKDPEKILFALDSGAVDYMSKPVHEVELTARLRVAIRLKRLQDQLHERSIRDPLTGLFNRRYLMDSLRRELDRAERHGQSVSLCLIDVDHFKKVNDTHGHDIGDVVLRQMAGLLTSSARSHDVVGRYGGEEFLLILPQTTESGALETMNRIREAAAAAGWGTPQKTLSITFSGGLATHPSTLWVGIEALLKGADEALYRAKEAGRNRIETA